MLDIGFNYVQIKNVPFHKNQVRVQDLTLQDLAFEFNFHLAIH